jgi:hypothetical protein
VPGSVQSVLAGRAEKCAAAPVVAQEDRAVRVAAGPAAVIGYRDAVPAETDILLDAQTLAKWLTEPLEVDQTGFLLEALATAPEEALDFLSCQVECHTTRGGEVGGLLQALRSQARGKHAKAAVALLSARAAEGAGDSTSARDHIHDALTHRPDLEPALHDAAQYAAAHGDYVGANNYLRRAEMPSPLQRALDEALAASTMDEVPRNSPCPCGSRRKFKACCRRSAVPALAARAQLLYALLGSYAERAPGVEVIRPLAERTADPERYAMFCLDVALFNGGLVEKFLAARGHWLRPEERDLIEQWRGIPFTPYETLDVQRGHGVTLRALPDGEPIHLADRLFSTSTQRLGLLCGRVLHDTAGPRLLALPVPAPRHRRRALQELLAAGPSAEQIADFFGPEPPVQARNSDGDDVHDCRVTYSVNQAQRVFDTLAEQLTQTGDDLLASHRQLPDGRTLNIAEIQRNGDEFTITANSPARLAVLEDLLRSVAPEATERNRRIERLSPEPDPDGREGRTVILETYFLDGCHDEDEANNRMSLDAEAAWLDNQGVIGNLSPRQASRSTDVAILAELRSTLDDIEAAFLDAQRQGRPTAGLMNPDRLRHVLALE